jgi:phosphoenolpyruvate synthase/pyruvate phosphate dikinase
MPATITSLNPTTATPTQALAVAGTGFASGARLSFEGGGLTIVDAVVVSSVLLNAVVPNVLQGAEGAVLVRATNPGEVASNAVALTLSAWPVETPVEPLVSLRTVKAELGIEITDTTRDPRIEAAIRITSNQIMSYCGRSFRLRTLTETLDGTGSELLAPNVTPVVTVLAAAIDGAAIDVATVKVYESFLKRAGGAVWPAGNRNVSLTYQGGYSTLPDEVATAAVLQTIHNLNAKQGVTSESNTISGVQTTYSAAGVCPAARTLLSRYRRVRFSIL